MNLRELYESGDNVKESQIPSEWKESFLKFIFGQTCLGEHKEDGTFEFVYYSHDFRIWYNQNRLSIERDIKINDVCKEGESYTPKK